MAAEVVYNTWNRRPPIGQMLALDNARALLTGFLEVEMAKGEEDCWGSRLVPLLWDTAEQLTRAFPENFEDLNDPLDRLAEGC